MKRLVLVLACACSSGHGTGTNGSGGGSSEPPATGCDGAKAKVEQLYRTEAGAKEKPERVAEAVSDNTQMVMNECVKSPDKVVGCLNRVTTAAELEKQCLAPLDEEGTEGEALRK